MYTFARNVRSSPFVEIKQIEITFFLILRCRNFLAKWDQLQLDARAEISVANLEIQKLYTVLKSIAI